MVFNLIQNYKIQQSAKPEPYSQEKGKGSFLTRKQFDRPIQLN